MCHHALHEVVGGALGAIGGASLGAMLGGPPAAFVGIIVGAGVGSYASAAADSNFARLIADEARQRRREGRRLRPRSVTRRTG